MVKMIMLGLAVLAATLGGTYAGLIASVQSNEPVGSKQNEVLEFVKLDATSVPIIRDGAIAGYVVVRAAFSAASYDVKQNRSWLTTFTAEALFKSLYEETSLNFAALKPVQLDALTERIAKAANRRLGRDGVKQLAVESLSYLTVDEVRCKQQQ